MVLSRDCSFEAVTSRKNEIMKNAIGMDYSLFESGSIAFDYERMMSEIGYSLEKVREIQGKFAVGNTPVIELRNLTALARKCTEAGKGARIFIKDEASNASGSFKARRAANAVYHAKKLGYKGVIAATSGNYGAAVASQAAMQGLKCIIVQECFDSGGVGQPEIIEKARKCEAYGAEVVQLTV
ncbi:MAG: pyridoxal-phosphate dependent enzyme, partial [Cellulosilyticaceae bacterium]